MQKKVSLKDIAQKVGVSIALVSYVMNNKRESRVSKDVRKKIMDTAAKLNYRPNQIARSLKTNKTYTIGLIVADISNPFSSSLARIIEDEAGNSSYTVIIGSSDEDVQKFSNLVSAFLNRQVDGLILFPPAGAESIIQDLKKQRFPFVLVDRYFPGMQVNSIYLNNYTMAFDAVQHLVEKGRKRIGMIAFTSPLAHLKDREKGYIDAIKKTQLCAPQTWLREVDINNDPMEIENAIQELLSLKQPVDALLFGSNRLAIVGLRYINSLSLKVPRDLAIVSFDETDVFDFFYAPLTYIKQPLQEMGQKAVDLLLEHIADPKKILQLELPAQLVIRKSTQG